MMPRLLLPLFCLFCAVATVGQSIDSLQMTFRNASLPQQQRVQAAVQATERLSTQQFAQADALAKEALPLASEPLQKGQLLTNRGRAQYLMGHYDTASQCYYQALQWLEPIGATKALGEAYNVLGRLYRKTRQFPRAYAAYDKAMKVFEGLKDSTGISTIFNESGVVFEYEEKYDQALARYQQALNIQQRMKDSLGMSYSLNFMAGVRTLQARHKEAVAYNSQALNIRSRLRDSIALALIHSDLATSYYKAGQPALATVQFASSNAIARRMGYADLLMANLRQQAELAKEAGQMNQAFAFLEEHGVIKDSVYKAQQTAAMEEMATRYETEERNQLIASQAKALRQRNWMLGLAALVMFLGATLGWQLLQKQRLRKDFAVQEAVLAERRSAAEAVLQAEDAERRRIAAELHDGLGQVMSAAHMQLNALEAALPLPLPDLQQRLRQVARMVSLCCQDIRVVSHNTMPADLLNNRLSDALFNLTAQMAGVVEMQLYGLGDIPEDQMLPQHKVALYRVVQEAVNNALKHGQASRLTLTVVQDAGELTFTLEDDGKGFDVAAKTEGIGLQNMRSRIKFLNGHINWDSEPGKGTVVMIYLPLSAREMAQAA